MASPYIFRTREARVATLDPLNCRISHEANARVAAFAHQSAFTRREANNWSRNGELSKLAGSWPPDVN